MGKPVTNPRKELIRVKIGKLAYALLLTLARTVVLKMTANTNFTTPVPALADITTAADDLQSALAKIGTKRNKGAHADVIDCRQKATTLRVLLIAEVGYVESTLSATADVPTYNAALASAGFGLKSLRSRVPRIQKIRNIQQSNNKQWEPSLGRLKWKRPLGLLKGLPVDGFNVYEGGKLRMTTTATNWITGQAAGQKLTYTIRPFNARGEGQATKVTVYT